MKFDKYDELLKIKNYSTFKHFIENNFLEEISKADNFSSLIEAISYASTFTTNVDDFWGNMLDFLETLAEDIDINYTLDDLQFASDLWRINLRKSPYKAEIVVPSLALYIPNKNLILNFKKSTLYECIDLRLHKGDRHYNTSVQFNIDSYDPVTINISSLDIDTLIINAPNASAIELLQWTYKVGSANLVFNSEVKKIVADSNEITVFPSVGQRSTLKFAYGKASNILPKIADEETIQVLEKLYAWN